MLIPSVGLALLVRSIVPAAFVALILALSVQSYRLEREEKEHAQTAAACAMEREAQHRAALEAEHHNRLLELRRLKDIKEIADAAQVKLDQATADAAAARDAAERLRHKLTAIVARPSRGAAPASAPAAQGSDAAPDPAHLLSDVLKRLDEASDEIAGFADASSVAGASCQSAYEALTL